MPTLVESSDLKPTFVAKPDMRFATTFLSTQYRDYAVNGETIQDKATGEIFTKRPVDGRVVSFFQNKKYMYDLMLELRVLLTNNEEFNYPKNTYTAFYLSTDYDLVAINDERMNNICVNNTVIPNTSDTMVHKLQFNLSRDTNGFFCRLTSRDSDKAVISWLTNEYNYIMKNYTGSNTEFLAEKKKFTDIEKWEDSNTIVYFNVTVTKGTDTRTYTTSEYIHINEQMSVMLPITNINTDFPDGYDYATVEISSFDYYKLHFMLNHKDILGDEFNEQLSQLIYPDNNIFINYCNICSFVDKSTQINLLGNEFIIAMLDVPYITRYMMKMSRLRENSDVVLSIERPGDDDWKTNGIWAERVRDVFEGGFVIDVGADINLKRLERHLAKNNKTITRAVSTDLFDTEDFYLYDPTKNSYTDDEIDKKIQRLYSYIANKADNIVSDSDATVTDNGLVLETVSTEETEE